MTTERRLAAIEAALSPTQLVLVWLDEAHPFGDLPPYIDWLLDQPDDVQPMDRLARQAAAGARAGLRGQRPEVVDAAVRRAVRETIFRFELVLRINVVTHEMLDREMLIDALLASQLALLSIDEPNERRTNPPGRPTVAACRDLLGDRVIELRAVEEARSTVEGRYLDARSAVFPDVATAWADQIRRTEGLAEGAARLAELDGADPRNAAEPDAVSGRSAVLVADFVDPAKVTALEKLGDTGRAFGIATRWVRSSMKPGGFLSDSDPDSGSQTLTP